MATVVAEQDNGMEVVAMSRELSTYEAMGGTYTEVDGVFYPILWFRRKQMCGLENMVCYGLII